MSYRIIPRREAGLPPSRADVDGTKIRAFVHYTDDKGRLKWTQARAASRVRGYYDFHTGPQRGWADIGYHFLVFQGWWGQPVYIFEGRPQNRIPAAQQGHNSGSLAVSVVAGPGETFMRSTEDAVAWIIKRFRHIEAVGGHRDVNSTDCPGDRIYARIGAIARKAGCRRM